jgi:ketosteroid isomerase-like protein
VPVGESELLRAFRDAVEDGHRAWNRGDVKSAYAPLPDELEYHLSPTWPEARVLRSRDEVIAFFEDFQGTFPDVRTADRRFLEGDEGILIVGFRVIGSGRTSGAGTEMEVWQVWEVRENEDGLTVTRVREFNDRGQALEAAGVAEPAGSEAE